jgi:N-acetylglucosaminyldiphosphoundecaprenol N-acetyl-beta-D-mannosaminyltransferase
MLFKRNCVAIIGVPIDSLTWDMALKQLYSWAIAHESRYVCICNVHSVVTASQDAAFNQIVSNADMATPDGAPVAWLMRKLGHADQQRINGPDLMWKYCEQTQYRDESVFFYGSSEATLALLKTKLSSAFPTLKIAGLISPPFRTLTSAEDMAIIEQINTSGANVVWVSLGCPKQELWMAEHRGRINAVMVGVGAAFDYHAGTLKRAPLWMQHNGLEWFYRLVSEPERLWKRYLITNTLFVLKAIRQLLLR